MIIAKKNSVLILNSKGETETIFSINQKAKGGDLMVHEPRPIIKRKKEFIRPKLSDWNKKMGTFILSDVTHGRNMVGVKNAEIKKLLIMECLPKPITANLWTEPIGFEGVFAMLRVIGIVPVEKDGSAYFEAPPLRPLMFVGLDENNLSVKRMQSFVSLMPGETVGCIGCHENRTETSNRQKQLLALSRPPSKIKIIEDIPYVFDFPRDIQPILDEHCIKCHNTSKATKHLDFSGDRTRRYSVSYYNIVTSYVSQGVNGRGNTPPIKIGSSDSKLMTMLLNGHQNIKLSEIEMKKIRLWIESGCLYAGTYGAEGTGIPGQSGKNRYAIIAEMRKFSDIYAKRCIQCHIIPSKGLREEYKKRLKPTYYTRQRETSCKSDKGLIAFPNGELLWNLTNYEKSFALFLPLAKEAGGAADYTGEPLEDGLYRKKPMKVLVRGKGHPVVFKSKEDPDYKELLRLISFVGDDLLRFDDIKNLELGEGYLREMKKYGIIPEDFDLKKSNMTSYDIDRKYFESFNYKPKNAVNIKK